MASYGENEKICKAEKKIRRKQAKSKHMLLKHVGIRTSEIPTRFLLLGNVGLVTGATQDILQYVFTPYGTLQQIILIPDKSYSFIVYMSIEDAEQAMLNCQGKPLVQGETTFINMYLSYATSVPEDAARFSATIHPDGLILLEEFVSKDYETQLLEICEWKDADLADKKILKHRKVKHYGFEFRYDINNVDKDQPLNDPIPPLCKPLFDQLLAKGYLTAYPDQLTVNQYEAGHGIPPHIDTHSAFEDGIVSLSLGSSIVMDFRHPDGRHLPVLLPARSVLIMTGPSRYIWSHGITPRKSDVIPTSDQNGVTLQPRGTRTSFTFRQVRKGSCHCSYPKQCDSQNKSISQDKLSNEILEKLESKHVQQVYNEIADHFSATRHKPWPRVVDFVKNLQPGSILIDVGCGNGKYLGLNRSIIEIGCDQCVKLTQICHDRQHEVFCSDILQLPIRNGVADACICIAVIHHLATEERRQVAIKQLVDLLRPGGKVLIYVWAMEQDAKPERSAYIKDSRVRAQQKASILDNSSSHAVTEDENDSSHAADVCSHQLTEDKSNEKITNNQNMLLPVHVNRTHFEYQDILVPWRLKNAEDIKDIEKPIYHRYYHVFQNGELEKLCLSVDGISITESYYDKGNWCVLLQRDA